MEVKKKLSNLLDMEHRPSGICGRSCRNVHKFQKKCKENNLIKMYLLEKKTDIRDV